MIKSILFSLCFLLFNTTLAVGQGKRIRETSISKKAILADLDEYRDGINKNHINPYTVIKKKVFFEAIEQLKEAADTLDTDGLLVQWLHVNATIRDEHTSIQYILRNLYPFILSSYEEGLFIIATNDENRKYYHSKILAVNGIPIEEVAKRIATLLPDTNAIVVKHKVPGMIIDPTLLHGLHVIADRDKATFTVLTPENGTQTVTPTPIDIRDRNQLTGLKGDNFLRSSVRGKYWFKYFDTGNYIYFQYASCVDDGNFNHVVETLEKTIEDKNPGKIIIDLRYNSGGNSSLLQPFIHYLATSPLNKKGKIYVLTGGKTFSAAVSNAAALKTQTYATFLGEETGEDVDHFGEIKAFTLSETGLKVFYSTKLFRSYNLGDGTLKPDVVIHETFADYDKNIDAVVDYAIAH